MAMYPCRLRNAMSRPVEIHRGGEVLVLNPGAFLALEAADPACERLERDGVLTRHAPEPKPVPKPKRKPKRGPAAKTATAWPVSAERKTAARTAKRPTGIPSRKGSSEDDTGGSS